MRKRKSKTVKLNHLSLAVKNCPASRDWYKSNIGLRLEFEATRGASRRSRMTPSSDFYCPRDAFAMTATATWLVRDLARSSARLER